MYLIQITVIFSMFSKLAAFDAQLHTSEIYFKSMFVNF